MCNVRELAIIILNWNNWQDTLECLSSLTLSTFKNFTIIVVDNDSSDGSIEKIKQWAKGGQSVFVGPPVNKEISNRKYELYEIDDANLDHENSDLNSDMVLIKNEENLGFAKGNNVGIRFALKYGFEKVFLLNNDTTVDSTCIEALVKFLNNNDEFAFITPKILYYDQPDIIWNYGGRLTFTGKSKYYLFNKRDIKHPEHDFKKITFITGCALFTRTGNFKKYGLLTEKFFFGEEDQELSLRMKKNGVNMAAINSAKVYHKISGSEKISFQNDILAKAYIHYLNRFINLKSFYNYRYWHFWRVITFLYILPMLKIRYKISIRRLFMFSRLLIKNSKFNDIVSRSDFFNAKALLK